MGCPEDLATCEAALSAANDTIAAHVATIAARDATIVTHLETIDERDATIVTHLETIDERDATIVTLTSQKNALQAQVNSLLHVAEPWLTVVREEVTYEFRARGIYFDGKKYSAAQVLADEGIVEALFGRGSILFKEVIS